MTLGQAMLWRSSTLLVYSVLLAVAYHIFVRYFEEPRLTELFGATYAKYCADVPRWWPRSPRAT
jgi:protein-S-isoprenylcysteine O-methyltransferase Ste14